VARWIAEFVGGAERTLDLSRSGELNAENMLEIEDAPLAERLAAYVDGVRSRYPRFVPDGA
jgi:hypothetical protein